MSLDWARNGVCEFLSAFPKTRIKYLGIQSADGQWYIRKKQYSWSQKRETRKQPDFSGRTDLDCNDYYLCNYWKVGAV